MGRSERVDPTAPTLPVLSIHFRTARIDVRYFSAITVLGTPQDVTAQELRIESFFPDDGPEGAAKRSERPAPRARAIE
ncbi:MAG: hypothetical protein H6737_23465 [Alphaproteobacteria bacterium]|nr:hypothetical protein [Alphaproteobacteria bacterium]